MVFNARSLCNKTFGVCEFLKSKQCDVCFISEAWVKLKHESVVAEIHDMGFGIKYKPRKGSRRGGGVCVLFKLGIDVEKCTTKSYKTFEVLQTTLKSSTNLIRVSTFYRTGSMSPLIRSKFSTELEDYLETLLQLQGENILCGDFNIHVEDKSSLNSQALLPIAESYGFKQVVSVPTHENGGTLDLLFVNPETGNCHQLIEKSLYVYDLCYSVTSDHNFIECLVPFAKDVPPPSSVKKSFRNFKSIDVEKFCGDVEKSLCLSKFFTLDVDAAINCFNGSLIEVLNEHAPIITKSFMIKKTEFTTPKVISNRRMRRRYERKYRKYRNPADLVMYQKYVNEVRNSVKVARNDFYGSKLEKSKGNKKKSFALLNRMLGKKTDQVLPDHVSEEDLCNDFANFFQNKVINIRDEITKDNASSAMFDSEVTYDCIPKFDNETIPVMKEFASAGRDHLTKIMNNLSNKQCELDILPTDFFKECTKYLVSFILYIINKSLSTGIFPKDFKHAIVRPSMKANTDDKNIFQNYRPLSNLCVFSKVLEKYVLQQLINHLDSNNLFGCFQSAYRKFHSCETAITKVSNDIFNTLDANNNVFLIFLDLSSAFDLVDHDILLKRLANRFHIKGVVLEWFKSYLKDRSYSVKIGCSISNGVLTFYGVPQGSILGPILFLLYVSAIEDIAKLYGLKIHMFADDMQLYISFVSTTIYENVSTIEHCLRHIKWWMSSNLLKINESKTQLLIVSPNNSSDCLLSDMLISFGGSIILSSDNTTNLGVKFDSSMSFENHINGITSKGYHYLNNFYRVADKLTFDLKVQLITTYILPLLDYCNVILTAATQSNVNKLQKLLNNAVRFVYSLNGRKRRYSITPFLKRLHILPVNYRIKYKLCLLVYKCIHGLAPKYLCELLTQKVTYERLRSSSDLLALHIDVPNRTYGEHAFSHVAPVQWNMLPQDLRFTPSLDDFKSRLKTHFFRKCYDE